MHASWVAANWIQSLHCHWQLQSPDIGYLDGKSSFKKRAPVGEGVEDVNESSHILCAYNTEELRNWEQLSAFQMVTAVITVPFGCYMQVPASMVFENGEFEPPTVVEAGGEFPGVGVAILNGAKQKVVKGYLYGQKQDYTVIQRVWFCPLGMTPFCTASTRRGAVLDCNRAWRE